MDVPEQTALCEYPGFTSVAPAYTALVAKLTDVTVGVPTVIAGVELALETAVPHCPPEPAVPLVSVTTKPKSHVLPIEGPSQPVAK